MTETTESTSEKSNSIWSVAFVTLMAANFFSMMSSNMCSTVLPVYLSSLGVGVALVGIIVGIFSVSAICARPFVGPAFDTFSRKRLLIACQLISAASMVGYAFISDPTIILLIRLVHGVGIGSTGPLAMSMVGERLPQGKMATGVSTYAISTSAGQVLGPATGLFVSDLLGFRLAYLLSAATLMLCVISLSTIKDIPRPKLPYKVSIERTFAKEAAGAAVVIALLCTAYASVGAYLVLMSREYGIDNVGFYFAIYALTLIVVAPQFGKLSDRIGCERVVLMCSAFFAASMVLMHFAHTIPLLVVTAVVSALGYGAAVPQVQTMAMRSVPVELAARANNTYYMGLDVGLLCGPVIGGFVVSNLALITPDMGTAYSDMWLVMIVPILAAVLLVLRWNAKAKAAKAGEIAATEASETAE